jgi:hypothetical protein
MGNIQQSVPWFFGSQLVGPYLVPFVGVCGCVVVNAKASVNIAWKDIYACPSVVRSRRMRYTKQITGVTMFLLVACAPFYREQERLCTAKCNGHNHVADYIQ